MGILDGLIAEKIFSPRYEFRISLVGFNDDIFHEVALSEFNFAANKSAASIFFRTLSKIVENISQT